MNIGFIGVGHIAEAIITGLHRKNNNYNILLSPRNQQRADRLAKKFRSTISIATSNQAVLDNSDVVFLTVRPQEAEAILSSLVFHNAHTVVSMIAMTPVSYISKWTSPAHQIYRLATLPYVSITDGPLLLYPESLYLSSVLNQLGKIEVAVDEQQLDALWSLTATMAAHFATAATMAKWASDKGVEKKQAERFINNMQASLSNYAEALHDIPLKELISQSQTAGGINEQFLVELKKQEYFKITYRALEHVILRFEAQKPT